MRGQGEAGRIEITSKPRIDTYLKEMKATRMTVLTAVLFLSACSGSPFQANLDSLEVTVPASLPTFGKVIYPAKAAMFQNSPVGFNTVSLVGNAAATNVLANVKANLYARTSDPVGTAGCSSESGVVICNAADQTKISPQSLSSPAMAAKPHSGSRTRTGC